MSHGAFEINNELIAWIKSQGMSMAQFAEGVGVSRATMTHISNHRNKVSDKLLAKAQAAYPDFPLKPANRSEAAGSNPAVKKKTARVSPPTPARAKAPALPKPYDSSTFMSPEQLIMVEGGYFDIKLRRDLKGK